MERLDRRSRKEKRPPGVPIKTYRWEEVRRSRKRGGYPWTHLYKRPFEEDLDVTPYTIRRSLRRRKSTSTMGDKSYLTISEITVESEREGSRTPDVEVEHIDCTLQVITEPDDEHSKAGSAANSVVIEECDEELPKAQFSLESGESSDDISQYVDKEERSPPKRDEKAEPVEAKMEDEASKRKRKLSAESSYSRISQTKSAIVRKLKETKDKIKIPKVPKLTLPVSKIRRQVPKKSKNSPPAAKKETVIQKSSKESNQKPVYIHIPLKPPPGETDEFSHFEFETKEVPKTDTKKPGSFRELIKNIKQIQEAQAQEDAKKGIDIQEEDISEKIPKEKSTPSAKGLLKKIKDASVRQETEKENEQIKGLQNEESTDKEVTKTDTMQEDERMSKENEATEEEQKRHSKNSSEFDGSHIYETLDESTKADELKNEETNQEDIFEHLFRKSSVKTELPSTSSRQVRSKSAEPERKRKLSLESSYSRKSLSKLGIMKKLKEASEKIKNTLSRSGSKQDQKPPEVKEAPKKSKELKPSKPVVPVYIHIPLKPPEGQTDEFSSLASESKEVQEPIAKEPETPDSVTTTQEGADGKVQLIILTAPSDDEVLDYHSSDVPETPSSESNFFLDKAELTMLAKDAADTVTPPKLEPVKEENGSERSAEDGDSIRDGTDLKKTDKGSEKVIDVEDGLSETKVVKGESVTQLPVPPEVQTQGASSTEEELKSSLKTGYGSPVMKKKVSFKRRSKSGKETPENKVEKLSALGPSQSMSVDEEKAYLDDKVVKSSSLEEDYTKWSKTIDHEYESVNPPSDPSLQQQVNSVCIIDTDIDPSILPLGSVPLDTETTIDITTEELPSPDRQPTFVKFAPTEEVVAYHDEPSKPEPSKFQRAFREHTENIKTKFHNIKRPQIKKPNIHLPDRPKFNKPNLQRFKIDKSKFHMPKIPDTAKINMPSFRKHPLKERNLSTEANDGDAKPSAFNFGTFPRMLKNIGKGRRRSEATDFATAPRAKKQETETTSTQDSSRWSGSESIRIPLHSEDSMDAVEAEDADQESSHIRYEHDIGIDDEYERQNNEYNTERDFRDRWEHGRFNVGEEEFVGHFGRSQKVTDLDSPDEPRGGYDFSSNTRDHHSSGSSANIHRSGVLEEINSDEFLWRQKGISQEDMNMRLYLTSEIKEAFKTPTNALAQLDDDQMRAYGSNQSLPETGGKRKPKKPKRKKTPHASQEKIHQYTGDSASEDLDSSPPSRPRRRSKRTRKQKNIDEVIPYQETIAVEPEDRFGHRESLGGILGDDEEENDSAMYENEMMAGKEQPEILITDPEFDREPSAPPRKHKSLKSLTMSENDSIPCIEQDIEVIKTDSKLIIPIEPEVVVEQAPTPTRPSRSRSRGTSRRASRDDENLSRSYSAMLEQEPCVEEPCVKTICDYMGYGIVDKDKVREPPLPPPRAPRKKRSTHQFFTVPRTKSGSEPPVRPLRNYSTLAHTKKVVEPPPSYENKENVDEQGKALHTGDVIKKMKDRPLPAPPRPPRKSRLLRDITSLENIANEVDKPSEETETATQTEPLPDDFVCEDVIQEPTDTVIIPSRSADQDTSTTVVERRLVTPTVYSYEETVTHGSLLVEPLDGAKILPDSELTRERIIPVTRESDFDETSSIPEEFNRLKDPPRTTQEPVKVSVNLSDLEIVKAQKLQVEDLDVDRLTVNKLLADKIVVSEIESSTINTNEISSHTGALKVGEISLPPGVIESIMKTMQSSQSPKEEVEKKTSMNERTLVEFSRTEEEEEEEPPAPPPRSVELENIVREMQLHQANLHTVEEPEAPPRPLRQSRLATSSSQEKDDDHQQEIPMRLLEPDVDDEPPPRPPQPSVDYIPSQPPASFYALRAQKFVESHGDNIPVVPNRRRRHTRSRHRTRSNSESSSPPPRRPQRRSSEPSLGQLSGQLVRVCATQANTSMKRLIGYLLNNVLANCDGKQDLNVMIVIVLVLIAGLILLGYGEEKTVVHLHHWEYFNPPRDL